MHVIVDCAVPPSKPTRPVVLWTTTSYIKLSFSVDCGTQPITRFLLKITRPEFGIESQEILELDRVNSLKERVNSIGIVMGYSVEIFVTGLQEREVYEFEVAAESSVGVGEFSEPSEGTRLGKIIL